MTPRLLHDYARDGQLKLLRQIAMDALSAFGIVAATVRLLRYEDNAVYEVRIEDRRRFALRLSIHDGRSVAEQRSELYWLDALRAEGVETPSSQTSVVKAGIHQFESPHLAKPATAVLFTWIDGKVKPPYGRPSVAAKFGMVTASLHDSAAQLQLPSWFRRPSWDPKDLFEAGGALTSPKGRERLAKSDQTRLFRVAERVHSQLDEFGTERQLIHADLHRENAILTPSGSIAIIDFDDCGFGDPGFDIATTLSSVYRQVRTAESGAYERFTGRYLAAYKSIRPLPLSLDRFASLLVMRDMVITNFVLTSPNPAVAEWGPGRVRGILDEMQIFLDTGNYVGYIDNVCGPTADESFEHLVG
jgi:Ser/Thr protein kinase RdoA (MazF antagonist)